MGKRLTGPFGGEGPWKGGVVCLGLLEDTGKSRSEQSLSANAIGPEGHSANLHPLRDEAP